jgi:hypothetical protein
VKRAFTRSAFGWAFGMAVSVLFLALWGRAVVVDTESLADSLSPLADSSFVVDLAADWMEEEMIESGADPAAAGPAIGYYFESASVRRALDEIVAEFVLGTASSRPGGASIDMASLFRPTVPDLTVAMAGMGYDLTENEVASVVAEFDPLVIRAPGDRALLGPHSPTAARLGTAALLAMFSLLVFGYGYAALSEDRVAAVRSLLHRVALGGLSFAIFLRLGAWVLDPSGGRAPVPRTLSELAGSKWGVPLQVAVVAALLAGVIYWARRAIRRRGGFPWPNGGSKPPSEREESLSGSR